jgi:hypothetical protein
MARRAPPVKRIETALGWSYAVRPSPSTRVAPLRSPGPTPGRREPSRGRNVVAAEHRPERGVWRDRDMVPRPLSCSRPGITPSLQDS